MTKKKEEGHKYIVVSPIRSDRTKKSYPVGAIIDNGDFPAAIIANWLEIGVLEVTDGDGHQ